VVGFPSKEPGYSLTMGLSGRNDLQEQQSGKSGWHRFLARLAICALLIQSIVPELAMAAREAMTRQAIAAEAHQGHGAYGHKEPERKPAHDLCAFCFVQAIQILPSASGEELILPSVFSIDRSSVRRSAPAVARQFLTCLHPRAPPHDARV
jgi:hypothetical protein